MKLRLLSFFAPWLLFVPLVCAQNERLDVEVFQDRVAEKGAQVVDVSTPEEFAKGHIAGALNIDWLADGFMDTASKLDKTKPVLLFCASGGRSEEALAAMKQAGFTDVADLKFGLNAWKRSNLPVTTR
jgi:rhodanese-related sulfurtransferase